MSWREFYKLFPFDDYHRFHRPAALVATRVGGGGVDSALRWLQPDPVMAGFSEADANTMRAFGVKPPAKKA